MTRGLHIQVLLGNHTNYPVSDVGVDTEINTILTITHYISTTVINNRANWTFYLIYPLFASLSLRIIIECI